MKDPIFREAAKWWFWDETGMTKFGPFITKIEATKAYLEYHGI